MPRFAAFCQVAIWPSKASVELPRLWSGRQALKISGWWMPNSRLTRTGSRLHAEGDWLSRDKMLGVNNFHERDPLHGHLWIWNRQRHQWLIIRVKPWHPILAGRTSRGVARVPWILGQGWEMLKRSKESIEFIHIHPKSWSLTRRSVDLGDLSAFQIKHAKIRGSR